MAQARKKSKPKSKSKPKTKPKTAANPSPERNLNLTGLMMTALGLLSGIILFSSRSTQLIADLYTLIRKGFGWGSYFLPILLLGGGVLILLRNVEGVPKFAPEQTAGISLLFLAGLTTMQFFTFPLDFQDSKYIASNGIGGGFVGVYILEPLRSTFGIAGTAIALFALILLSLSLALNIPILELFQWVPGALKAVKNLYLKLFPGREKPAPIIQTPPQRITVPDLKTPPPPKITIGKSDTPSMFHDPIPDLNWILPHVPDILNIGIDIEPNEEFDLHRASIIEETLDSFGSPGHVVEINRGPTITQFGVEPDFVEVRGQKRRVRVSKITSLADDLALALAARSIRMEAPVPGKGFVGMEVPNEEISLVALRDAIQSPHFKRNKNPLRFALGQDVSGVAIAADLADMPHLLIAGTTGSGKSVCVNSLISCFLLHNTPDDLRMIMVDPKRVELSGYDGIPHLLAPVVVDLERVVGVLQWVSREMDQRYQKFSEAGARHIIDFNKKTVNDGGVKLPYLVVIIDELADLMMLAPAETEKAITRLAQLARATGIHLIISTQRPSTNVVTGLIKANFPARIAFATASGVDSRVILDQPGAETLLGRGDMLFQSPDAAAPVRLQGVYVSDTEIDKLVKYWRVLGAQIKGPIGGTSASGEPDAKMPSIPLKQKEMWEDMAEETEFDPLWDDAVKIVRAEDRASISMLQRRLRIGYTRAARIIDTMAAEGIIGPAKDGPQARQVLDHKPEDPFSKE
ncbi:MAG: DNA translocase FtsK [Anaerolineales bacterium]|nr:DNA translocase FtsK [Anaerolineales bacterium]